MNNDELSIFVCIRKITQAIKTYNSRMLRLLDKNRVHFEKMPELRELHDHLDYWLKKYKKTFDRPEVSLIYEYDKPFPQTVRELVERKILS